MPRVGPLEIRADDSRTMVVTVDDRMTRQFEHTLKLDLSTGRHRIEIRTQGGRLVLTRVVDIDPFDVTRIRIEDRVPDALSYRDHDDDDRRNDRNDDRGDHAAYTSR
jgi:hypothetical protein